MNVLNKDGHVSNLVYGRIYEVVEEAISKEDKSKIDLSEEIAKSIFKKLEIFTTETLNAQGEIIKTVDSNIIDKLIEEEFILGDYRDALEFFRKKKSKKINKKEVPEEISQLTEESKKYFSNDLSEYVYFTSYSKWMPEKSRRETWVETVDRYIEFMRENLSDKLTNKEYDTIKESILNMRALGSMRLLWSAGPAARATNVAAYNCAYIAPTKWRDFGEIAYILMCGTGIGFSVEEQTVSKLQCIEYQTGEKLEEYFIEDSKEGWADAIILGLKTWSSGKDIKFNYSRIRPQGARLKTMGGRASGPEPLKNLLEFSRERIMKKQGRRLSPIDVHDIICKIGEVVVMGGVRRSALISLSDLDNIEMKEAKNGHFYNSHPERMMANNSAVYNDKPDVEVFLEEWLNLIKGKSGERGIFNRGGLKKQLPARRWEKFNGDFRTSGMNPCGEIILKSRQFCNLSEVVARPDDTEDDLIEKVKIATILGTYQASLTKFPYLSKKWKDNCEEEALLGVSITGQWDCPALRNQQTMKKLKEIAIETNKKYAKKFGINESTAITCVKPSGNGSQLFNCSSGCHARHAKYYIRRVRIESHNPVFHMLKDMGIPYHPEVGQNIESASTYVLEFPVRSPKRTVTRDTLNANDQLEYWKMLKDNYTEHNPSITISVADNEWLSVGNWLYENWDMIGGLSFLPRSEHVYKLAPFEEITREKYEELSSKFPKIDFSKIVLYEYEDATTGSKELACTAGSCEIEHIEEENK